MSVLALAGCATVSKSATEAGFALPERFTALGTEPFWAAKVDGARLTYSTPEDQAGRTITVTRQNEARVVVIEGKLDGRLLRLRIGAGPCSDGMSDVVYPFAVERTEGNAVHNGCARAD
jgi:uncharacterized membrane protein